MIDVLYIHGMGGGGDSRIPSILSEELDSRGLSLAVRTYDFDPDVGAEQIASWMHELQPSLLIGESLGALQAMRVTGIPHIYVSPALNGPFYLELLAWLTLIPGVTALFDRIYRPKEGDRQSLHFTFKVLRKYRGHRKIALAVSRSSSDSHYAFFGVSDHYRRSGIVSLRTWRKHFGDAFSLYDGTHFMEEEYVRTILLDVILLSLGINK